MIPITFNFQVGRSPIPQFDAFNLKPARQYYFRVTARSRRGVEFEAMTRGRVDLSKATAVPVVRTPTTPYKRVLRGTGLGLECQFSGEPTPTFRWTHTSSSGTVRVLEEGVSSAQIEKQEDKKVEEEEEAASGPIIVARINVDKIEASDAGRLIFGLSPFMSVLSDMRLCAIGKYTCEMTNAAGRASTSCQVDVVESEKVFRSYEKAKK